MILNGIGSDSISKQNKIIVHISRVFKMEDLRSDIAVRLTVLERKMESK
jgi:hypothetical protein